MTVEETERAIATVEQVTAELSMRCDRLREAADGLEQWYRANRAGLGRDAGMHPLHVINRIRKVANEISRNNKGPR